MSNNKSLILILWPFLMRSRFAKAGRAWSIGRRYQPLGKVIKHMVQDLREKQYDAQAELRQGVYRRPKDYSWIPLEQRLRPALLCWQDFHNSADASWEHAFNEPCQKLSGQKGPDYV